MLSRDALVVRGGKQRSAEFLAGRVADGVEKGEPCAISVWAHDALPGESRADLLARITQEASTPHPSIQVARHGDLIDAGFELALDTSNEQAACHYNVAVRFPIDEAELQSFISCFGEPEDKPIGGGQQR